MAMAAGHGPMMMVQADVLGVHSCAERASSRGGDGVVLSMGAATRTMRIGRRSEGFGCSSVEVERMHRLTIARGSRSSGRQEALRSQQSPDVVVGGVADAMAEEPMASFWDRLQLAWRVLLGAPSEAQATKKRFSRLLVRDRGFSSANLSRLYNAAKGAIKEHVELEGDEDTEVTAVVDRLGELRLDFRVKRVRSLLRDEPFSDSVLPEMDPSLTISGDQLWEDSRAPHGSKVRVGGHLDEPLPTSALPDVEPSLSISDQSWEYNRAPLDLKTRVGLALDRPFPKSVIPDEEPILSTSGGRLWRDNRASQDTKVVVGGASNLKSHTRRGALDETFPKSVPLDEEPSLSISGDQLWKDSRISQDPDEQVGVTSLKSTTVAGPLDEPFPNSILPNKGASRSSRGDRLLEDSAAPQDLEVHAAEAFDLMSTMEVIVEGEWYTFSFADAKVGKRIGATKGHDDFDK